MAATKRSRPISFKEIIDYLGETSPEDNLQLVYIEPPNVEDDKDAEDDGDGQEGHMDVPSCQFKANCEVIMSNGRRATTFEDLSKSSESVGKNTIITQEVHSNLEDPLSIPVAIKNETFLWSKDVSLPSFLRFPSTDYDPVSLHVKAHEQFEKFFDKTLLKYISDEIIRYAYFTGKQEPSITIDEIKAFIGILIISGYNIHPQEKMLWSNHDDLKNIMIEKCMKRKRFEQILEFLQFEDGERKGTDGDKMWKLRPITDHLKSNMMKHFQPEQQLTYGECMISYFGRRGYKEFIKGKPLRFGYKAWSLCTTNGYLVNFEIHQENNPRLNKFEDEVCKKNAIPLLKMISDFEDNDKILPYSFYFNSSIANIPLLVRLQTERYDATGIIQEKDIPRCCPISSNENMETHKRGYAEAIDMQETGIRITKWVDNGVVCIASTSSSINPVAHVQRYTDASKKKITISKPYVLEDYDKHINAVNKMDQNINLYRIGVHNKKWWSSIFTWLIDVSIHNAWLLHRLQNPSMSQLEFRRQLAAQYCKSKDPEPKETAIVFDTREEEPVSPPKKRKRESSVFNTLRYDGIDHWPRCAKNRRRCNSSTCSSTVRTECQKCNVGLCVKCFKDYHTM